MRAATGCLMGQALGDALGAPTEFLTVSQIRRHFPPNGPQEPTGDPILVTDDTQMMLAVGQSLYDLAMPATPDGFEPVLRQAFITWRNSPENNRAPGMTCMSACERLEAGLPWHEATIINSKGAGANMRVAPVGLFAYAHQLDGQTQAALAQFQAALTHGHPTALAAADLTAWVVAELSSKNTHPDDLLPKLRAYAESQHTVYHSSWLGPLWQRAFVNSPEAFISRGWDECLSALRRVEQAITTHDTKTDPCELTGDGWIAEEALATGLLCFLLFVDDPVAAIRRAALTSGDSDTIASLTGAFAGAYHGLDAWPEMWVAHLEYREQLITLGRAWDMV
ncbi:MAG: ADP-ribosylglycohydrolase family protein [Chloroflexi bacterium]|nr:ADP-ribosylglycohydrolase family protein [Chloroflexota bacterium]